MALLTRSEGFALALYALILNCCNPSTAEKVFDKLFEKFRAPSVTIPFFGRPKGWMMCLENFSKISLLVALAWIGIAIVYKHHTSVIIKNEVGRLSSMSLA